MRLLRPVPERLTRWVLVACLAGLAFRLVVTFGYPRSITGDALWYVHHAGVYAAEGPFGPDTGKFDRPPLYPAFLGVFRALFGEGWMTPARLAQCLLTASSAWCAAQLARRAFPLRPWVTVAAAWLAALDPWSVEWTKGFYTENLANPLAMAFAAALADALAGPDGAPRPGIGRAGAARIAVAGGLLILTRTEFAVIVVPGGAAAAWIALRAHARAGYGGRPGGSAENDAPGADVCAAPTSGPAAHRRIALWWAVATAGPVLLCLPWSALTTARLGRPTFVSSTRIAPWTAENGGWIRLCSTLHLPRGEWLATAWAGPAGAEPSWFPDAEFDAPGERERFVVALGRAHAGLASAAEIDDAMGALADERIARAPLRYAVGLPARRVASMWLDPTETDVCSRLDLSPKNLPGRAFGWLGTAWVVVGAIGFVAACAGVFVRRGAAAVLGLLILLRTVSLQAYGVVAGHAMYERRYLTCVEPLAQVLAAAAVAGAVAAWTARRAHAAAASRSHGSSG